MLIAIIIGIVLLLFVIGLFQKKDEQKAFREYNQVQGGFRASFPVLTNMLEDDLEMKLIVDTGDNFFYQKEIEYNGTLLAIFRIGRKVDYIRNTLLYTELITNKGEKISGLPICIEGEVNVIEYKKWISKSYNQILQNRLYLTNTSFFKYFLVIEINDLTKTKEQEFIHSLPFNTKENYFNFWHSLNELKPILDGKRITCIVITKYTTKLELDDEISIYNYLVLGLIKDRNLKTTDTFFSNFNMMQDLEEKIEWHEFQVQRLLEKIEINELNDIGFNEVSDGDKLSFDIKYNEPPILQYSGEDSTSGTYQLSWEELEKRDYWADINEYEFSNFSFEKTA